MPNTKIITLWACLLLVGCYSKSRVETQHKIYPDVEGTIKKALSNRNTGYSKTATIKGKTETQQPDTLHRTREADLLTVVDINKPAWQGLFTVDSTTHATGSKSYTYTTNKDKIKVKKLTTHFDAQGRLSNIVATTHDKNLLFDSHRIVNITLAYNPEGPFMKNYFVKGYQKVLLKDTTYYQISLKAIN